MVTYIFVTERLRMRRDVFQAIADPTRRDIIDLLSQGPQTLNGIAENFTISRPAISKHIRILEECGLVVIEDRGRERLCGIRLSRLKEASGWLDQYRRFWTGKLSALEKHLQSIENLKPKK
jgi:DNA-binding transcriptional ArsR family regulator